MLKLQGKDIYLAALERNDCKKLYQDAEYNPADPADSTLFGYSIEKSDDWYEEIQKLLRENENIRLGIFLNDGTIIGDVALQGIDSINRSCSVGIGIAKIENRSKGYGKQAVRLMLDYGFNNIGMERITAETLEVNFASQKALEGAGFVLEGRARKASYFRGKKYDVMHYGLLAEEWNLAVCGIKKLCS